MRLIYVIFKFILFPGTYIRGFWEHLTCKILHLPVESEGYLRADEACGHVEHALATTPWSAWLMATGPGFMMFNAGMAFLYAGILNIFYMGITPYDSIGMFIFYVILIYLGVSFLCSLFPLTEDILTYWDLSIHYRAEDYINSVIVYCSFVFAGIGLAFRIGLKDKLAALNWKTGILYLIILIALSLTLSLISWLVIGLIKHSIKDFYKKVLPNYFKGLVLPFKLFFPLVTRIGAFCEKNCINFILAIVFIVLHIVFLG